MSLLYIGQQITIYGGLFVVIIGIIGNGINILVFSTERTYRTIPCTFYYLIGSIDNIIYISINLISRVISAGSGYDLTRTSTSWCKIRQFFIYTLSLITLSCSCLATIDQFFVTSQNFFIRRLSNIKWARRIAIVMIIFWCLHGIPVILVYTPSSIVNACININDGFKIYIRVYLLGLICGIPAAIMSIFGYLTYRNIHQTIVLAQQHADRQLTRMILFQVILVVVCIVPYGINSAYSLITSNVSKDTNRLLIENFALTIITLLSYFYYAGSCYMFLLSSIRFRRATKDQILFCLRANQVAALEGGSIERAM